MCQLRGDKWSAEWRPGCSNPECGEEGGGGGGGLSRSARGAMMVLPLIMSQARQNFTQCLKRNASVLIRPANQV